MGDTRFAYLEAMFERCPEPLAMVEGDSVIAANRAFRARIGEAPSLRGCVEAADHGALSASREAAREEAASLVARPATGSHAGARMRWTIWPAGEGVQCVRLDGPAAAPERLPEPLAPLAGDPSSVRARILLEAFDRMDAILWAIAKDGTVLVSDGNGLKYYGMTPGQLVGQNALEVYPPGSNAYEDTARALRGERLRLDSINAQDYWVRFIEPIRDAGGEVTAMIGLGIRVTENARGMLQAKTLFAAAEQLPMSLWAMDLDGTCVLSVGKGLERVGLSSHRLVGQNLNELYRDRDDFAEHTGRAFAGEAFSVDVSIGESHWRNHYFPLFDTFGQKVVRICCVSEDVTEQVLHQEQLRAQLELIQTQQLAILGLSSPIIEVWAGVLVVPIIGELDGERASSLLERLLDRVVERQSGAVILDLTGVERVDAESAARLSKIMRALALLGCEGLVSGVGPGVAKAVVELAVDLPARGVHRTLAEALGRWLAQRAR